MAEVFQPAFANFAGPWRDAFAWLPVRLFSGQWIWLGAYKRRRVVKKDHLPGPDWSGWFCALPGDFVDQLRSGQQ